MSDTVMAPVRQQGRPLTTKEARRAYNKRGGISSMRPSQRAKLIRELEREEKREKELEQEAGRRARSKLRERERAEARVEFRKLGVPDPTIKVRPSQPRIGNFLKRDAKAAELDDVGDGAGFSLPALSLVGSPQANASLSPSTVDGDLWRSTSPSPHMAAAGKPSPESVEADGALGDRSCLPKSNSQDHSNMERMPPLEIGSSFFVSDSQIERELSHDAEDYTEQSNRAPYSATQSSSSSVRKIRPCESHEFIMPPETGLAVEKDRLSHTVMDDVALLLKAIPSQEFQKLDTEESYEDLITVLGRLPSQEWTDIDA